MSLGALLIKPQLLSLPPTPKESASIEVFIEFLESFSRNPRFSITAVTIMGEEIVSGFRALVVGKEERLRFADGKFRNLFRPFGEALDIFINGLEEGILETVPAFLGALAKVTEQLSSDKISALLEEFFNLIENDLGINNEVMGSFFTALLTRTAGQLKNSFLQGDTSEEAIALYDFGVGLEGIQHTLTKETELPGFNARPFIAMVKQGLETSGFGKIVSKLRSVLELSENLIGPIASLAQSIMKMTEQDEDPQPANPLGAAAVNGDTSVDLKVDEYPDDPIAWYASWIAGEKLRYPEDTSQSTNLFVNRHLVGFSYKHVKREQMEKLAFHTAWAVPVLESLVTHAMSIEQGDLAANLTNIGVNLLDASLIGFAEIKLPPWLHWAAFPIYNILAGFEGGRWADVLGDDPYVWTNVAGDVGEAVLYRRWSWLLRELVLSFVTLLNNDPEEFRKWRNSAPDNLRSEVARAAKQHNNNCIEGICYVMGELGALVLPGTFSEADRLNYGFINGTLPGQAFGKAVLGSVISWASMYLGVFWTLLISGEWPSDWGRYGRLVLKERIYGDYDFSGAWKGIWSVSRGLVAIFQYITDYFIYLYLFTDGDTDDGRYCADPNGTERQFMGYPGDVDNSPYLLPWAAGETKQCVQGNMGIWSHFPRSFGPQTYAYDFSHNLGDEVLCSRAGIITAFRDTVPRSNSNQWNFIKIMHIVILAPKVGLPATPAPPDPGNSTYHTKYNNGTPIPAGTLFPPYWDAVGGVGFNPPLHPTATADAILTALSLPPDSTFAFIVHDVDRALPGRTFPPESKFSNGTLIPANVVFPPDIGNSPPPNSQFAAGTTFLPPSASPAKAFTPLRATFAVYGHGDANFMTTVFGTSSRNALLGRFVKQGELIMIADDTGVSAYNHLHTHIVGLSNQNFSFTLPFVYKDVKHNAGEHGLFKAGRRDGVPRAMTYYTSRNNKVS